MERHEMPPPGDIGAERSPTVLPPWRGQAGCQVRTGFLHNMARLGAVNPTRVQRNPTVLFSVCAVSGMPQCDLPEIPAYQGVIDDLDFCRFAELRRSCAAACRSCCC